MSNLLSGVFVFITTVMSKFSYAGVILLMGLESANIPIPSEAIMPFAGYLVSKGDMNIYIASLAGALGCLLGSLISYYLGYYGGRAFVEKYGKYIFISKHDLEVSDKLFQKYGDKISFLSRLLPVVRTFISFPLGIARVNVKKFAIYTFLGSLIWSYVLTMIGVKIGDNQALLEPYFRKFDIAIVAIVLIGVGYYIYRHVKKSN